MEDSQQSKGGETEIPCKFCADEVCHLTGSSVIRMEKA
jgi:hypothetical protein